MSRRTLHYIDGYNLIHRVNLGQNRSLEQRREMLIRLVQGWGLAAWIVFDSRESVGRGNIEHPIRRITVEYARGGLSADDVIVRRIERTANLKEVVVVTDDLPLRDRCRFFGARVMRVEKFIGGHQQKMQPSRPQPGKKLSHTEIDDWKQFFGFDDDEDLKRRLRELGIDTEGPGSLGPDDFRIG